MKQMTELFRWFFKKKVLFIASSSEAALKLKKDFIARTGFPESETCAYVNATKKNSGNLDCGTYSVIFSTAEVIFVNCHFKNFFAFNTAT